MRETVKEEWKYIEGSKDAYVSNLGNFKKKVNGRWKKLK